MVDRPGTIGTFGKSRNVWLSGSRISPTKLTVQAVSPPCHRPGEFCKAPLAVVGAAPPIKRSYSSPGSIWRSALIGASRWSQIEDSLGALDHLEFSAEELSEIDRYANDGGLNLWATSSDGG